MPPRVARQMAFQSQRSSDSSSSPFQLKAHHAICCSSISSRSVGFLFQSLEVSIPIVAAWESQSRLITNAMIAGGYFLLVFSLAQSSISAQISQAIRSETSSAVQI